MWAGEEAWWAWNPVAPPPPLLAFKEANIDPGPPPGMPLGFTKEAEIQININQVVEHLTLKKFQSLKPDLAIFEYYATVLSLTK